MKKLLFPLILIAALFSGLPQVQAQTKAQPSPVMLKAEKKLNINTASANQLIMLPGIGEAKANAIIAYRQQHGAFNSIAELGKVKGIGQKILSQLANDIAVK